MSQIGCIQCHLSFALVFTIATDEYMPPSDVLSEIVAIYNQEFSDEIEDDPSIQISMDVE